MNEVVELGSVSEITRNKKFFQKKKKVAFSSLIDTLMC